MNWFNRCPVYKFKSSCRGWGQSFTCSGWGIAVSCMVNARVRRIRGAKHVQGQVVMWLYLQNLVAGQLPPLRERWDSNLGDIILGMSVIQRECCADKVGLMNRLPVIVTHGLCHLVGYHHDDEHSAKLVRLCSYLPYLNFMRILCMCVCGRGGGGSLFSIFILSRNAMILEICSKELKKYSAELSLLTFRCTWRRTPCLQTLTLVLEPNWVPWLHCSYDMDGSGLRTGNWLLWEHPGVEVTEKSSCQRLPV